MAEIRGSEHGQLRWLQQLSEYGLSVVHAPTVPGIVTELAKTISYPQVGMVWFGAWCSFVQVTVYGEDFDVVATDNPVNIAYTSLPLELHQDLVYLESPPGPCRFTSTNVH